VARVFPSHACNPSLARIWPHMVFLSSLVSISLPSSSMTVVQCSSFPSLWFCSQDDGGQIYFSSTPSGSPRSHMDAILGHLGKSVRDNLVGGCTSVSLYPNKTIAFVVP